MMFKKIVHATIFCVVIVCLAFPVAADDTAWYLELDGAQKESIDNSTFEGCVGCHKVNYTDQDGKVWVGIPLYYLMGRVDDDSPHGEGAFNDSLASEGYEVEVITGDGYSITFNSTYLADIDDYFVACYLNDSMLPYFDDGGKPLTPLKLVGPELSGEQKVGNIVNITLNLSAAPSPDESWNLTLVGDKTEVYSISEIKSMPSYSESGGFKKSTGKIVGPYSYTGVNMTYLADLVGGMTSENSIKVTASDGYSMTYTYEQVMGNLATYNVNTGDPEPNGQIVMVLATKEDASPIKTSNGGPLRIAFTGTNTPITEGHFWTKYVAKIEIIGEVDEWNLSMSGRLSEDIDRSTFESCVGCHGVNFIDDENRNWSGIPAWMLAGTVDDLKTHAFNDGLSDVGYMLSVIAGDGYNKSFESHRIKRNNDIIVANEINGTAIPRGSSSFPLKFTGPDLVKNENVKNVVEIVLDMPPVPSASLTATANIEIPMIGITLNRLEIDYGRVAAGDKSDNETVEITNIGSSEVSITLEVDATSKTGQDFYEASLYLNDDLYNPVRKITSIPSQEDDDVTTQLRILPE
ncbi:MAG: hypothetical protein SVJ22_10960, partial [Halobacteriota archaeon]|nr:hypothetical protein [Halobacteriota archaeon]